MRKMNQSVRYEIMFAIALVPLVTCAEDNVLLYGRINISAEKTKVSCNGSNRSCASVGKNEVVDNNSCVGFRGKEDLGGGLTAIFKIESKVQVDVGGGTFASRDSWVGLSGKFGTFKMGRMYGPVYSNTVDWVSQHNHDTGNSADVLWDSNKDIGDPRYPVPFGVGRNSNVVYYSSPKFGGFKIEANYSLLTESATKPVEIEIAASYDFGVLRTAFGYGETRNSLANADADGRKDKGWSGALYYNHKAYTLAALVDHSEVNLPNGLSYKRNYARISTRIPLGSHEIHLNFGRASKLSDTTNTGADQWTVAYNFNLSKRTKLYAMYTKVDNGSVDPSIPGSGGAYGFLTHIPGADNSSFGVGIRQYF